LKLSAEDHFENIINDVSEIDGFLLSVYEEIEYVLSFSYIAKSKD
jgi:hypothetical protein